MLLERAWEDCLIPELALDYEQTTLLVECMPPLRTFMIGVGITNGASFLSPWSFRICT